MEWWNNIPTGVLTNSAIHHRAASVERRFLIQDADCSYKALGLKLPHVAKTDLIFVNVLRAEIPKAI